MCSMGPISAMGAVETVRTLLNGERPPNLVQSPR
jgi:hypothetical protein